VSKRTAAIAVLAALVVGVVIGIAWHEPRSMNLPDDIRTWAGFVIVIIGAGVALWQLDMQRRQLADQQQVIEGEVERNMRRDALLDGQLRELEQRTRILDRFQAEDIDLVPNCTTREVPGFNPSSGERAHSADVANASRRPIRDIACRIEAMPGSGLQQARLAGLYSEAPVAISSGRGMSSRTFLDPVESSLIPLMRAGDRGAFIFAVGGQQYPEARITVRFTDDAGLHWQLGHDLHLETLDHRGDW
jgi:hypothetical protein